MWWVRGSDLTVVCVAAWLQVEVGTMVKAGDDVDVYAFASVLDLQRAAVRGAATGVT